MFPAMELKDKVGGGSIVRRRGEEKGGKVGQILHFLALPPSPSLYCCLLLLLLKSERYAANYK